MSWYIDPQLFLRYNVSKRKYYIYRIQKKYNVPLSHGDIMKIEKLEFSKHLSLGSNQESDYDALKHWLNESCHYKFVNCQGLVAYRGNVDCPGTWARVEEDDSIFYSLPGIINPSEIKLAEKRDVEIKISELLTEISSLKDKLDYEVTKLKSEVTYLQEQLNREKNDREAQVSDLTTKLEECRGVGGSIDGVYVRCTWARVEEDDSIFYSLPGIINPFEIKLAEKRDVEIKISKLLAEISSLKDKLDFEVTKLNSEKNHREAQVSDLTTKLEECRGVGGSIDGVYVRCNNT
ncbi:hypothetical protein MKX01_042802 [Papaver californicum]|nr:hypothetical protein MKX01_042802 [Papaver californicum]